MYKGDLIQNIEPNGTLECLKDVCKTLTLKYIKMKIRSIFLLASIGVFSLSCSGVKVVTDLDKTVDFTEHKSAEYYGWADNSDKILNDLQKARIEKAFGAEFKKRGIEFVEEGKGDMIVTLYVITEAKTQVTANTTSMGGYGGYGYGGYYGYGPGYGWGGGHSTTTFNEYDYTDGTLIVSVYDAEKKQLIWEAIGSKTIDDNPRDPEANAAKVAEQIMYNYPVKPVK